MAPLIFIPKVRVWSAVFCVRSWHTNVWHKALNFLLKVNWYLKKRDRIPVNWIFKMETMFRYNTYFRIDCYCSDEPKSLHCYYFVHITVIPWCYDLKWSWLRQNVSNPCYDFHWNNYNYRHHSLLSFWFVMCMKAWSYLRLQAEEMVSRCRGYLRMY